MPLRRVAGDCERRSSALLIVEIHEILLRTDGKYLRYLELDGAGGKMLRPKGFSVSILDLQLAFHCIAIIR